MTNAYLVQQPHSNSNKTDKYRVVRHRDWLDWLDRNDKAQVVPAASEHDTYKEAEVACGRLNDRLREERN